jgi:hypothetical protein
VLAGSYVSSATYKGGAGFAAGEATAVTRTVQRSATTLT